MLAAVEKAANNTKSKLMHLTTRMLLPETVIRNRTSHRQEIATDHTVRNKLVTTNTIIKKDRKYTSQICRARSIQTKTSLTSRFVQSLIRTRENQSEFQFHPYPSSSHQTASLSTPISKLPLRTGSTRLVHPLVLLRMLFRRVQTMWAPYTRTVSSPISLQIRPMKETPTNKVTCRRTDKTLSNLIEASNRRIQLKKFSPIKLTGTKL